MGPPPIVTVPSIRLVVSAALPFVVPVNTSSQIRKAVIDTFINIPP